MPNLLDDNSLEQGMRAAKEYADDKINSLDDIAILIKGDKGADGTVIFPITSNCDTLPENGRIGDYILNISGDGLFVGITPSISLQSGGLAKIVSVDPFGVDDTNGCLKGPKGEDGPATIFTPTGTKGVPIYIDGNGVLRSIPTLDGNFGLGHQVMNNGVSGLRNTALGGRSLANHVITGINNTAIGYESIFTIIEGSDNTAVGYRTLFTLANGGYIIPL